MKRKLNEKNYIVIADWMLELGLNTRELLTYALIYGFCQDKEGCYYGSLEYLASWLGIEDRTNATRYLKPLVEKGLITKEDVRTKINQKACIYRTLINRGDPTKEAEVDYIIIQPWMVQNLHLNGKDLLLYALVHSYSRKGSDNFCSYKKEYFAKWLQCRKDNLDRQIEKATNKSLIKAVDGGYVAIVPKEIALPQTDNTPCEEELDFTQIDNTYPQTDNTDALKLTTNNLYNNLNNNILNNNIDNTYTPKPFVVEKELDEYVKNILYKSNSFKQYTESGNVMPFVNAAERLIKMIKKQSKKKRQNICCFSESQILKLLEAALEAENNILDTFNNPDGYIVSKINDEIEKITLKGESTYENSRTIYS